MSSSCHQQTEVLNWHPRVEGVLTPDVKLPYVLNEAARASEGARVLAIVGFGEAYASAQAVISELEEEHIPAAAAWLSYTALPSAEANLWRIAVEAPRELAQQLGRDVPVHLISHSLGCLTANAAAEAPEKFDGVGLQAPYIFAHDTLGRLPVVGSSQLSRLLAVGWHLGIETPLQMRHRIGDDDVRAVGLRAVGEAARLGRSALNYGLSAKLGERTLDGFMRLVDMGHPSGVFLANDDRLVGAEAVIASLDRVAAKQGIDPSSIDIRRLAGPHAPWCSPEGLAQLRSGAVDWLKTIRPPQKV